MYTLSGENQYQLAQALRKQTDAFVRTYGDYDIEYVDGTESTLQSVREKLSSLPFLSDKRCVVLRNPSKIPGFSDAHEDVFAVDNQAVDIIIVEPNLDNRTNYAKFLKKQTEYTEFKDVDQKSAPAWVQEKAEELGGSISRSDASFLVQRVGVDQHLLHNELDKLIAYDTSVTRKSIELLCDPTPQSSIFDLLDAALSGKAERALALYEDQRAQKVEAQQIVAMLARQVHLLALVASAPKDKNNQAIAKDARVHPFAIEKISQVVRIVGREHVPSLVTQLRDIDRLQKTSSLDLDEAIKSFIVSISK